MRLEVTIGLILIVAQKEALIGCRPNGGEWWQWQWGGKVRKCLRWTGCILRVIRVLHFKSTGSLVAELTLMMMVLVLGLMLVLQLRGQKLNGRWRLVDAWISYVGNDGLQCALFDVLLELVARLVFALRVECHMNATVAVILFRIRFDDGSQCGCS